MNSLEIVDYCNNNQAWVTLCDGENEWTAEDAMVVCRQVGYTGEYSSCSTCSYSRDGRLCYIYAPFGSKQCFANLIGGLEYNNGAVYSFTLQVAPFNMTTSMREYTMREYTTRALCSLSVREMRVALTVVQM